MFGEKILDWSFTTNYMYICYSTQCTFIFSILVRLNVTSKLSKTSFEMNVVHKTKKRKLLYNLPIEVYKYREH